MEELVGESGEAHGSVRLDVEKDNLVRCNFISQVSLIFTYLLVLTAYQSTTARLESVQRRHSDFSKFSNQVTRRGIRRGESSALHARGAPCRLAQLYCRS